MQKFTHLDTLDRARRPRSKAPLVVLFLLVLLATPPLFELAKLNVARMGLFGIVHADTPLLDFLSVHWETSHSEIRDWAAPYLAHRKWDPRMVIPFAFFWTALGAMMLRRGH